jgi:hypothetical protein
MDKIKKLSIAGFNTCSAFVQARTALLGLSTIFPKDFEVVVNGCSSIYIFYINFY